MRLADRERTEARMTVERIDLSRHAVIEASAGTGKTFTIERLVLRLLTETPTSLENILLVTFAEKATGELKTRLRERLEKALHEQPQHRSAIIGALDRFDQAAIFTIHAFCQRLLQEYALEQGQDFHSALVDDDDLVPEALREVQRKLWRSHFGDRLRAVLEAAAFNRRTRAEWDSQMCELARKYQPRSDHQLRPAAVSDWWQRLDEPGAKWAGQLQVFTVDAIRRHLADYKQQRGLLSFDDMIGIVEENLDPERNADAHTLIHRLRDRYRFGIVDEFQDTDPLQWRIFHRIFVEAGKSRLFVVGDPKQAIFAFRGADLPTYLRARGELREQAGADFLPLDTNWRSAPELLDALNCLFLDGDWFPRESRIDYREVRAPEEEERSTRIITDVTNRAALSIVDVRPWDKLKDARKNYARFAAHEIRRLLTGTGSQPALVFAHKGSAPRPLSASDICILVFKRAEAEPLREELEKLDIPYSFYKPAGLWKSEEVLQLETLLLCLSRPEDRSSLRKALLTCFFRVRPAELVQCQDLPATHPARQLYQQWLGYAEARQWSALFQSLLEETGLLLQALENDARAQQLSTLRHVMGTLERVGHGENRDLLGLIDWIREQRRTRDHGEAAQPPADMVRPRVRIMTIHASKGLEFPIVFLAGGFTAGRRAAGLVSYRDEQGRKVFDCCPDGEAQSRMADEAVAESRRLLYVALTRPMFKLYVPMVHITSSSRKYSGPAGTVLLPALKQACPDKLGPLFAEVITTPRLLELVRAAPTSTDRVPEVAPPIVYTGSLFPMLDAHLERRRIVVRSFSSMSRAHLAAEDERPNYSDQAHPPADETASPAEHDDALRGPVFGSMVHSVLESIDYAAVAQCSDAAGLLVENTPTRLLIDKVMLADLVNLHGKPREELEQTARAQIAQLVWNALHTPLSEAGGVLARVPAADRIHELEFQFPDGIAEEARQSVRSSRRFKAERREEGFVAGFMDLVFRHAGRYFLVDFKTNLLPGYAAEHLARCMEEADYHRQYRLYLHALYRWLMRVHDNDYPFLRNFGGVYYLFVRGLNGRDETAGVFFHRPTAEDLDLERAMRV
jgi:exodeoxyribonuclease V beta subunit